MRLARLPSSGGISPVNWFLGRLKLSRLPRFPNSEGIAPVSLLLERSKSVRLERLPNSEGIVPVSSLLERSKTVRLERLPSSGGISPVNRLPKPRSNFVRLARLPNSDGIAPFNPLWYKTNSDTRLFVVVTPFQWLMPTSADQFRLPSAPVRVSFAASRVAQSATRPGLSAGFGTATPLEHWAVNWFANGSGMGEAVAPSAPVSSRDMAIADARARAVVVLIARVGMGFIRLFSFSALPNALILSQRDHSGFRLRRHGSRARAWARLGGLGAHA